MAARKSWQHRQINMVASSTAGTSRGLYLRCRQLPVWTNAVPALDVGESWLPRAESQEVNPNSERGRMPFLGFAWRQDIRLIWTLWVRSRDARTICVSLQILRNLNALASPSTIMLRSAPSCSRIYPFVPLVQLQPPPSIHTIHSFNCNMRASLLLPSLAALVTISSAATVPGLPSCAGSCVGTDFGGCGTLNVQCICSNTALIASLACCVSTACDAADQEG